MYIYDPIGQKEGVNVSVNEGRLFYIRRGAKHSFLFEQKWTKQTIAEVLIEGVRIKWSDQST